LRGKSRGLFKGIRTKTIDTHVTVQKDDTENKRHTPNAILISQCQENGRVRVTENKWGRQMSDRGRVRGAPLMIDGRKELILQHRDGIQTGASPSGSTAVRNTRTSSTAELVTTVEDANQIRFSRFCKPRLLQVQVHCRSADTQPLYCVTCSLYPFTIQVKFVFRVMLQSLVRWAVVRKAVCVCI